MSAFQRRFNRSSLNSEKHEIRSKREPSFLKRLEKKNRLSLKKILPSDPEKQQKKKRKQNKLAKTIQQFVQEYHGPASFSAVLNYSNQNIPNHDRRSLSEAMYTYHTISRQQKKDHQLHDEPAELAFCNALNAFNSRLPDNANIKQFNKFNRYYATTVTEHRKIYKHWIKSHSPKCAQCCFAKRDEIDAEDSVKQLPKSENISKAHSLAPEENLRHTFFECPFIKQFIDPFVLQLDTKIGSATRSECGFRTLWFTIDRPEISNNTLVYYLINGYLPGNAKHIAKLTPMLGNETAILSYLTKKINKTINLIIVNKKIAHLNLLSLRTLL